MTLETRDPQDDGVPSAIRLLKAEDARPLAERVWECYDQTFGDFTDFATWRSQLYERHAGRDGFRIAAAIEDDQVTGFAWGYVGQRDQYWSDLVHDALPADVVARWVGGHFELVELAVLPDRRRSGLGQRLHGRLLDGIGRRCLLSTRDDPEDPAVRLYTRAGWQRLGVLRPGVQVMGLDLTSHEE